MAIRGAILGDIAGLQYEFDRPKYLDWKSCELYTRRCRFTDDSVMSLAIKSAVDNGLDYQNEMIGLGRLYPDCGYGGNFYRWIFCRHPKPYGSFGNGSAMRVSYIGEYYDDMRDVLIRFDAAIGRGDPEREDEYEENKVIEKAYSV